MIFFIKNKINKEKIDGLKNLFYQSRFFLKIFNKGKKMLDGMIILWTILTILSVIYVSCDLIFITPNPYLMKIGWILVTLYTGVFGLFIYLLSCKEPMAQTHEEFIKPLWKHAVGSTIHCLAGDATGIIILAVFLSFFRVSIPFEITLEYIGGFAFGLLIFQSIFMKKMLKGNYFYAVRKTLFPEWLSMNLIMGGMIPVMVIWMILDPISKDPTSLHFFARMSLASIVGAFFSFFGNRWLVKHGLKHGMMTTRKDEKLETMKEKTHSEQVSRTKLSLAMFLSFLGLSIGVVISIIFAKTYTSI